MTTLERKVQEIDVEKPLDEDCCPDDTRVITVYEVAYDDCRRRADDEDAIDGRAPKSTCLFRLPESARRFADRCKGAVITPRPVTTRQYTLLRQANRIGDY